MAISRVPCADNTFFSAALATQATTGTSRVPHTAAIAVNDLVLTYQNAFNQGSTGSPTYADTDGAGNITLKAAVEVGGVVYPVTFAGQLSIALAPGGLINSDPIPLELAAGTQFFTRTEITPATTWHGNNAASVSAGAGGFTATTGLTVTGAGAIADSSSTKFGPSAIYGSPALSTAKQGVLIVGDSIGQGVGDLAAGFVGRNVNPSISGGGFISRALCGVAGQVQTAIPGEAATGFLSFANRFRRLTIAQHCGTAICEYGRNDVSGGRTFTQIATDLLALWTILNQRGLRVIQTTITPKSTSTDNWKTTGNQTKTTDDAVRYLVNHWLRSGAPVSPGGVPVQKGQSGDYHALTSGSTGHPLYAVWEVADVVESARNSGIFKGATVNRTLNDVVTTGSSNTITSATGNFTSADIGRTLYVTGAGTSGAEFVSTIHRVNSATSIATFDTTPTGVSAAAATIADSYTRDGTHPTGFAHTLIAASLDISLLA